MKNANNVQKDFAGFAARETNEMTRPTIGFAQPQIGPGANGSRVRPPAFLPSQANLTGHPVSSAASSNIWHSLPPEGLTSSPPFFHQDQAPASRVNPTHLSPYSTAQYGSKFYIFMLNTAQSLTATSPSSFLR
jgi:hypothetical protein